MNITKIKIKNLFGITETELDGKSVEFRGKNGVGKTSIIDAIRLALTNQSNRDVVVRSGAEEGEILIETDSSLSIYRKKRIGQADYKMIKEDNKAVMSPERYLSDIFTPLQLNPTEFTKMSSQDQNRAILNLIEFDWDLKWIEEKFGEIPKGVNYDQHILKVLEEIQSEKGFYYQSRQDINREARNKESFCVDIIKTLPEHYDAEKWREYSLSEKYAELNKKKDENSKIERAKVFASAYNAKMSAIRATRDEAIQLEKDLISDEKNELHKKIERLKAEIKAAEDKIAGLDDRLNDKIKVAEAQAEAAVEKLNSEYKSAEKYAEKEITPTDALETEIQFAEKMKTHLNEYDRMVRMKKEIKTLEEQSAALTSKIELARNLPAEILKTAKIPLKNLTVENGVPLINGRPISNLSTGEQLDLCVDVALSKPGRLKILLIDEISVLDTASRERLYEKCRKNGLQFIATRTSDSDEMEVVYL